MSNILAETSLGPFHSMVKLFNQSVVTTFDNVRDEMPEGRTKGFNSDGFHAAIE